MMIDVEETLPKDALMLWVVGLNSEGLRLVQHSGLAERLGLERIFYTLEQAVESYLKGFDGQSRVVGG